MKNYSLTEGLFDNLDIENMTAEEIMKELNNIDSEIDNRSKKIKTKVAVATILSGTITGAVLGGTGMYILGENCKESESSSSSFTIGTNYMI